MYSKYILEYNFICEKKDLNIYSLFFYFVAIFFKIVLFLLLLIFFVLITRTKNTRIRLTRLTALQIFQSWAFPRYSLGSLGFFLDWTLLVSPWAGLSSIPEVGCSQLQLGLGALSASSRVGCSLSFSFTQMAGCTCKALRCQSQKWFYVHQTEITLTYLLC